MVQLENSMMAAAHRVLSVENAIYIWLNFIERNAVYPKCVSERVVIFKGNTIHEMSNQFAFPKENRRTSSFISLLCFSRSRPAYP